MVRDGYEKLSFENALAAERGRKESGKYHAGWYYSSWGYYYEKIKPYFDLFPRDQIAIFSYDEIQQNCEKVLSESCRHIGVDESFRFDVRPRFNVSGIPKSQFIHQCVQQAKDGNWLFNILNKPFTTNRWIRTVKWVENANFSRPAMSSIARSTLMTQYEDDTSRLSALVGRNFASEWSVEKCDGRRTG